MLCGLRDTHTTRKCLPFLLPSLLCRVCSQALVQIPVSLLVSGESTELFNIPTGSIRSVNTHWLSVCLLTARSSVATLCTHGQDSVVGVLRYGCESWGSVEGEENLEPSLGHVASTSTSCVVDDGESSKSGFLVCSVKIV